ncbi:MAG: transposase [Elusimicrobia bacterium]|nr:transposase [Elusimicrobiota bacterium]
MARGNARETIFFQPRDWERFLDILADLKRSRPFKLYAYCLMSNHLHLLIEPLAASISNIMGLLLGRYAKYLNARLDRVGHVFQDRFKTSLCPKDAYFKHLVRYIHFNPVRAGMAEDPAGWPYSSHHEYLGQRGRGLVDQDLLLSMFHEDVQVARWEYRSYMTEGLESASTIVRSILPAPAEPLQAVGEYFNIDSCRATLEELAVISAKSSGISLAQLRSPGKVSAVCQARRRFAAAAFDSGYTVTEIALYLRISLPAVSRALGAISAEVK